MGGTSSGNQGKVLLEDSNNIANTDERGEDIDAAVFHPMGSCAEDIAPMRNQVLKFMMMISQHRRIFLKNFWSTGIYKSHILGSIETGMKSISMRL